MGAWARELGLSPSVVVSNVVSWQGRSYVRVRSEGCWEPVRRRGFKGRVMRSSLNAPRRPLYVRVPGWQRASQRDAERTSVPGPHSRPGLYMHTVARVLHRWRETRGRRAHLDGLYQPIGSCRPPPSARTTQIPELKCASGTLPGGAVRPRQCQADTDTPGDAVTCQALAQVDDGRRGLAPVQPSRSVYRLVTGPLAPPMGSRQKRCGQGLLRRKGGLAEWRGCTTAV